MADAHCLADITEGAEISGALREAVGDLGITAVVCSLADHPKMPLREIEVTVTFDGARDLIEALQELEERRRG